MFTGPKKYEKEFDKLFFAKRYFVQSIVSSYIDRDDIRDDIIQQVFLSVYLNMRKILKMEHVNSYLHRMTVNKVMDYFRRTDTLSLQNSNIDIAGLSDDTQISSEQSMSAEDLQKRFNDVLRAFPKKRRNVMALRIIENRSYREISEILGTTEVSARNLFSKGLKVLQQKLLPQEKGA